VNGIETLAMLQFAVLACLLVSVARCDEQDTHNPVEAILLHNAVDIVGHHHVELTVNISAISGRNAWAEVSWSGVHHPAFDDWIGVMVPAHADVRESTPVKYKPATSSSTHLEEGRGSTT
jgi:hypothetical protein